MLCKAACDGTALAEYSVKLRVMVLPSRQQSALCGCVRWYCHQGRVLCEAVCDGTAIQAECYVLFLYGKL